MITLGVIPILVRAGAVCKTKDRRHTESDKDKDDDDHDPVVTKTTWLKPQTKDLQYGGGVASHLTKVTKLPENQ